MPQTAGFPALPPYAQGKTHKWQEYWRSCNRQKNSHHPRQKLQHSPSHRKIGQLLTPLLGSAQSEAAVRSLLSLPDTFFKVNKKIHMEILVEKKGCLEYK
jgi:hypothetical protein